MSPSAYKLLYVLPLTRRSTCCLFSTSICKAMPRTPSTSSTKWKDYINHKDTEEGSDVVLTTRFGGIRLDSMNKGIVRDEVMIVGNLSKTTESDENNNSDLFFEHDVPSEIKEYNSYTVKNDKNDIPYDEHIQEDISSKISSVKRNESFSRKRICTNG